MKRARIATAAAAALITFSLLACEDEEEARPPTPTDESTESADPGTDGLPEAADLGALLGGNRPAAIPAPPDVAAPPADAETTESGLASKVLEAGTGDAHPGPRDVVTAHYTGWTTDGNMFDSSQTRGEPIEIPLDRVVPGWTEGIQLMVAGEKRRFWIPQELAYQGRPGAPPGMLVFDVELISFTAAPEPPAVPSDVARIPRNAQRTESGLASRVLTPGTGTAHPTPENLVTIHYTGWTTDGEMLESSVTSGRPVTFPLARATMQGWIEGVQMMVEGEKRRFWIPAELAATGRPGGPEGMVVFDIELVGVREMPQMPQMPGMPPGMPRPGGPGGAGGPGGPGGRPPSPH